MNHDRAALDTDSLLRLALLLLVVLLALQVFEEVLGMLLGPFGALRPLVTLVVLVLLGLFLYRRL